MSDIIKIKCPGVELSKAERIKMIVEQEFKRWITEPLLQEVARIFEPEFKLNDNLSTVEIVTMMKHFVEKHWDYRKKQKEATTKEGESARWLLQSEEIIEKNANIILSCAKKLGLIDNEESYLDNIEYILPLGGARMSNLRRTELAKKIIDRKNLTGVNVVALSGMRPLAESEMNGFIDTYAPKAKFEFEAISKGLELAFNCIEYTENKEKHENPNKDYVVRKYDAVYAGNCIYSIAAPSTIPEQRRANSADCFKFFFDQFEIKKGTQILNSTSQIYCSYQQVRALFFAIQYDVVFDTVGFPFGLNSPSGSNNTNQLSKPVNYLQEMKATVDAIYDFVEEFIK